MRLFKHHLPMLTLILVSATKVHAQSHPTDSARIYQQQLRQLYREVYDSLQKTEQYKTTVHNYERLKKIPPADSVSNKYYSWNLFTECSGINFDGFNADNAKAGFGKMGAGPGIRGGLGFTVENRNRIVIDFYFFTLSGDKAAYNGGQKIKYSFADLLQVNLGYDLIKSIKLNIYPYAGISIRSETLSWHNPGEINGNYTGIADILNNEEGFSSNRTSFAYHTGLGIDWVIAESASQHHEKGAAGGIMLFARGGTEGAIGNPAFHIRDIKYKPGIHNGEWIASLGIKFFVRGR